VANIDLFVAVQKKKFPLPKKVLDNPSQSDIIMGRSLERKKGCQPAKKKNLFGRKAMRASSKTALKNGKSHLALTARNTASISQKSSLQIAMIPCGKP